MKISTSLMLLFTIAFTISSKVSAQIIPDALYACHTVADLDYYGTIIKDYVLGEEYYAKGKDLSSLRTSNDSLNYSRTNADFEKYFYYDVGCLLKPLEYTPPDYSCDGDGGHTGVASFKGPNEFYTEAELQQQIIDQCVPGNVYGGSLCQNVGPVIHGKTYNQKIVSGYSSKCQISTSEGDVDNDGVPDDRDQCDGDPRPVEKDNVYDSMFEDVKLRGCSKDLCPELATHEGRVKIME
ncbi:MAG: hypothetical protein EOP04_10365, partial [Proteobacteria bacterium]